VVGLIRSFTKLMRLESLSTALGLTMDEAVYIIIKNTDWQKDKLLASGCSYEY
jgi:hypothetical protein